MIDYIILTKEIHAIEPVFLGLDKPLEAFGLSFDPITYNGEIIAYKTLINGLRLTIRGQQLTIQNSICKYYHGYNHQNFTYSEFIKAVSSLENKMQMSLRDAKIRSMEYGIVLRVQDAAQVYKSLGMYKNKKPQEMSFKGKCYGSYFENSTHKFKFYDKTLEAKRNDIHLKETLLRIEKSVSLNHINSSPRFKNNQIVILDDLCKRKTFELLGEDLINSLTKIELMDVNYYIDSLEIKDLRLLAYMENYPIREAVKKRFSKSYTLDRTKYQHILDDYRQNRQDTFIQQSYEIIERCIYN